MINLPKTVSICFGGEQLVQYIPHDRAVFQVVAPLLLMTFAYIDVFSGIKTSLRFAAHARAKNIKRVKIVTEVTAITTIVLVVGWIPNTLCA